MMFKRNRPAVRTTALSDFIRNASSQEKKRVYATVLKKSTEKQNQLLKRRHQSSIKAGQT